MVLTSTILATFSGGLLSSMAVNAFAAALPKPGTVRIISFKDFLDVAYRFSYNFFIGFMSLKLGHDVQPITSDEKQIETIKVESTTEQIKKGD